MTPWTIDCPAPLSEELSSQEYWSRLSFPSPGDLPDPGIEPRSPALEAESLPTELQGKSQKAECQRIDAFELWCWRRILRIPWTTRRSNQSILKEISPDYSLEGLMLKLKLQYSGPLMGRADSLEKVLGKIEGEGANRGRDGWMASPTRRAWVWAGSGSCCWVLQSTGSERVRHDWTAITNTFSFFI